MGHELRALDQAPRLHVLLLTELKRLAVMVLVGKLVEHGHSAAPHHWPGEVVVKHPHHVADVHRDVSTAGGRVAVEEDDEVHLVAVGVSVEGRSHDGSVHLTLGSKILYLEGDWLAIHEGQVTLLAETQRFHGEVQVPLSSLNLMLGQVLPHDFLFAADVGKLACDLGALADGHDVVPHLVALHQHAAPGVGAQDLLLLAHGIMLVRDDVTRSTHLAMRAFHHPLGAPVLQMLLHVLDQDVQHTAGSSLWLALVGARHQSVGGVGRECNHSDLAAHWSLVIHVYQASFTPGAILGLLGRRRKSTYRHIHIHNLISCCCYCCCLCLF